MPGISPNEGITIAEGITLIPGIGFGGIDDPGGGSPPYVPPDFGDGTWYWDFINQPDIEPTWDFNRSGGQYSIETLPPDGPETFTNFFGDQEWVITQYGLQLEAAGVNELSDTEDIVVGWNYNFATNLGKHLTIPDPSGDFNAVHIRLDDPSQASVSKTSIDSTGKRLSMWARTVSGEGTIRLLHINSSSYPIQTVTEQWQRFDLPDDVTSWFYIFDTRNAGTSITDLLVWAPCLEDLSFASSTMVGPSVQSRDTSTAGVDFADMPLPTDQLSNFTLITRFTLLGIAPGTPPTLASLQQESGTANWLTMYLQGSTDGLYMQHRSNSNSNQSLLGTVSRGDFCDVRVSVDDASLIGILNNNAAVTIASQGAFSQPMTKATLNRYVLGGATHGYISVQDIFVANYTLTEEQLKNWPDYRRVFHKDFKADKTVAPFTYVRSGGAYAEQSDSTTLLYPDDNTAAFSRYGLQLEDAGTNALLDPDDLSTSNWLKHQGIQVTQGFLAPDGTLTAWRIFNPNGAGASGGMVRADGQPGFTAATGRSVWIKAAPGTPPGKVMVLEFGSGVGEGILSDITDTWQRFEKQRPDALFYLVDFRSDFTSIDDIHVWAPVAETSTFATSTINPPVYPTRNDVTSNLSLSSTDLRDDIYKDFSVLYKVHPKYDSSVALGETKYLYSIRPDGSNYLEVLMLTNEVRIRPRTPTSFKDISLPATWEAGDELDVRVSWDRDNNVIASLNGVTGTPVTMDEDMVLPLTLVRLNRRQSAGIGYTDASSFTMTDYALNSQELWWYPLEPQAYSYNFKAEQTVPDNINFSRTGGQNAIQSPSSVEFYEDQEPAFTPNGLLLEEASANILGNPDFSGGWSQDGGAAITQHGSELGPDGLTPAWHVTGMNSVGARIRRTAEVNDFDRLSIWVRSLSGTGTVSVLGAEGTTVATVTPEWSRWDQGKTANPYYIFDNVTGAGVSGLDEMLVWAHSREANRPYPTSPMPSPSLTSRTEVKTYGAITSMGQRGNIVNDVSAICTFVYQGKPVAGSVGHIMSLVGTAIADRFFIGVDDSDNLSVQKVVGNTSVATMALGTITRGTRYEVRFSCTTTGCVAMLDKGTGVPDANTADLSTSVINVMFGHRDQAEITGNGTWVDMELESFAVEGVGRTEAELLAWNP